MQNLIVVRPFGPHRPGDAIAEPDEAARVLASEHAGHVVRCEGIGGAPAEVKAAPQAPAQPAVPTQSKSGEK